MKLVKLLLPVVCLVLSVPSLAVEPPAGFADLVEKLTPAVVNISTSQKIRGNFPGMQMFEMPQPGEMPEEFRDFFEQFARPEGKMIEHEVYSLGSGFIIDENGYVVTNNHVIGDAEEISVILSDDTKLKARVVGRDAKTDIALLKVDAGRKLPFVTLGDSDVSRVGDWVIAIGNPFKLGGTVTAGIISARARNINAGQFDDFIQTDAAINRGNSGGPMFNMKGEVIGINTAILSPTGGSVGIGFAIPTALAKPVLAQLKASGHTERGWLGIKVQQVTEEMAESLGLPKAEGAFVASVSKGGPAEKAGILTGDVITRFDGRSIREMRNLPRFVAETKNGKTVPVELWRKGGLKTINVTVGQLQENENPGNLAGVEEENRNHAVTGNASDITGLSLAPASSDILARYGFTDTIQGVIITRIKPESEAARRGLKAGDVITQVGDTVTASPKEVVEAIAALRKQGRKYALLHIARAREDTVFITLPVEEGK